MYQGPPAFLLILAKSVASLGLLIASPFQEPHDSILWGYKDASVSKLDWIIYNHTHITYNLQGELTVQGFSISLKYPKSNFPGKWFK